ncbi:MAG: D-glycero-beta-D-manno-heptose 1-phosphate adenylyltransferase [Lentisphaerae bacterium]|jgi:rfaE bifunctional protein nucleotidyltransferase chain/domain|nr:D-glycero-beta-D-manno-heptose 1-phosphate adenylyltransferase [Lentisphaerota bacterium]
MCLSGKRVDLETMVAERERLRDAGRRVVFTNGCFDILHLGHVQYLTFARRQGDVLVIGLNSDASVRRNKGPKRPIVPEEERAALLLALRCVDYVVLFDEETPEKLIGRLVPDVLVKGRDWAHFVAGREVVEAAGGRVVLADLVPGRSTTGTIERILEVYGGKET